MTSVHIEISIPLLGKSLLEDLRMLTITDLIAVLGLCATFYSLGYVRGKHDSKIQKLPPEPDKLSGYF